MVYITHIRLTGGEGFKQITQVRWEQPSYSRSGEYTRACTGSAEIGLLGLKSTVLARSMMRVE